MATNPDTVRIPVIVKGYVELPYDLQARSDMYGTCVPTECVQIDWDNDPTYFLIGELEYEEIELPTEGTKLKNLDKDDHPWPV